MRSVVTQPSTSCSRFKAILRANAGTAAVNILMVLGLVVTGTTMTATAMGSEVQEAFDNSVTDGGGAQPIAATDSKQSDRNSADASGLKQHAGWKRGFADTLLIVTTLCTVAASWIVLRQRKELRTLKSNKRASSLSALTPQLLTRLKKKREDLSNLLSEDTAAFLKGQMQVRHVMTDELIVVDPDESVEEVSLIMSDESVRHLLVCDEDNHLLGVISNRDLTSRSGQTAGELMTPDPITISSDAPLSCAVTPLTQNVISCLPVIEEDRLSGVITTTDLIMSMQCTLQMLFELAQQIQPELAEAPDSSSMAETAAHELVLQ